MTPEPRWSILIATVPSRSRNLLPDLLDALRYQIGEKPIEILWFGDTKWRSVGAKRTGLLRLARGDFISFIDDDDRVADDYIERIYRVIESHPMVDVICYDHLCTIDGGEPILCKYSLDFEYAWTPKVWTGKPAHTQTWRRLLVQDIQFPDLNIGEDTDWVALACRQVLHEVQLGGEPLYFYNMRTDLSETRGDGLLRDVPTTLRGWWEAARGAG